MGPIEMIISAREKDLGGFSVRRILPYATRRMVGPFIFFDHMGPANFEPGRGLDVRPHPHINLATVTYLFEGVIRHRDSLGSDQLIEPGAINWMTAGRGIVHSERTPDDLREQGSRLSGIQCWVALPEEYEEIAPSFTHHPSSSLPEFEREGVTLKLLLGKILNYSSPVPIHSDLFYLEAKLPKGSRLTLPVGDREAAVYVVSGRVRMDGDGKDIGETLMVVVQKRIGEELMITIEAKESSRVMLLGGRPVGKRHIYWNFVSSSEERIELAKDEWKHFPNLGEERRFSLIPGDDKEFIPLPPDENLEAKSKRTKKTKNTKNPPGTIM